MPAGTLGAAFPKEGIEDIVTPLDNERAKERRRVACKATQYMLTRTEQDMYHKDPTNKKYERNY